MANLQITNYTTLKTAVSDYLNRFDLIDQIPLFIQLAEQDLRRNLLAAPVRVSTNLNAGFDVVTLFSGELLTLAMDTDAYKHDIRLTTFAALNELRRSGSGVPLYGAVSGTSVYLDIKPDQDYLVIHTYRPLFTPLSDSVATNPVLLSAPDAYLFGALKEAAPFLEHDERNILWSQKYQKAVLDENVARERALYSAAPMQPRLPIILG